MNRKTHVLGVPFDVVTMDEAVARAEGLLKEKGQHFICTPNPEIVMEARKDAELMSILREADLVVPGRNRCCMGIQVQRDSLAGACGRL